MQLTEATERRDSREREQDRKRDRTEAKGYVLTGAQLAREIAGAVRAEPGTRSLSDDERDALAQEVAVAVLRTHGAEVARGDVGRNYLRTWVRKYLQAEGEAGRGWRDVAATWQERDRADREQRRTARVEMWSLDHLSDHGQERPDLLTRAALGALGRASAEQEKAADVVAPVMLAQAVAHVLLADAGDLLTERDRRCIDAALRVAAGEPVAVLAARSGRSLKATRNDVEHGRSLLRESAADVRAAVAHVRDRLDRAARPDVLRLTPAEQAASAAIERTQAEAKRRGTAQPSANIGTHDGGASRLPLRRFRMAGGERGTDAR